VWLVTGRKELSEAVFFPGLKGYSQSGHHPWEEGFFLFQFCVFKSLVNFFRLHTTKTRNFKIFQKSNGHSAKIRKRKNPEIWNMKKKWQSSKEYLAKSGYKPEIKYKSLIILLFVWVHNESQI
jgi:hypothetical protein